MKRIIALTTALALTACGQPSQNTYNEADIGHNAVILYGIVKSVRPVDIKAQTTGVGAVAGAGAGAIGGSYLGRGGGSLIGLIGGAVIGGIAGAVAEQQLENRQGIEYIIQFVSYPTQSIVQNIAKDDKPIAVGQCVMVQMNGTYQRILPDDNTADCEPLHAGHKFDISKADDLELGYTTLDDAIDMFGEPVFKNKILTGNNTRVGWYYLTGAQGQKLILLFNRHDVLVKILDKQD